MRNEDIDRESLFVMVWDRPTTEVAKELGISDVALGKLCQRLQVPKPPRGYWAKIKAGQISKRPSLRAFSEATQRKLERKRKKENESKPQILVNLSEVQKEFLNLALQELADAGVSTVDIDIASQGIRSIGADLTAQIIILIQNRYESWFDADESTAITLHGAFKSVCSLVTKLLPFAKEQIVVFHRENEQGLPKQGPISIVRFQSALQHRVANLCLLAQKNKLPYVASELRSTDHAWSVRHIGTPKTLSTIDTLLCVSSHEVWLQCEVKWTWNKLVDRFLSERLPVQQLISPELLKNEDILLPALVPRAIAFPYENRLKALMDAENIFDILVSAAFNNERAIPDERLAMVERLWIGGGDPGPFLNAKRALGRFKKELEDWENYLFAEKAELCRDILGIEKGDLVCFKSKGQVVRIRIDDLSLIVSESEISFRIYGTRFRKDGTLGKKQELLSLEVENDID